MSQLPLIIAIKRHFDSNIEFLEQLTNRGIAEAKAELLYEEEKPKLVAVIEVSRDKDEKYNVIMKIEKHCDCKGLQREFIFARGSSRLVCPICNINFNKDREINATEEQAQELVTTNS